jgi:redox-sensitive bicupin YhaK (pirin superfamily)
VLTWRSAERFTTVGDGVRTRHLVSFGDHYDPARTSLGPLIAHNDEVVEPGSGYAPHRHRGVEIVTWVVAGRLVHRDRDGEAVLVAGGAQVLRAGSGVEHEETGGSMDAADDDPLTAPRPLGATRFIQMWLPSDEAAPPHHSTAHFDDASLRSRLTAVAAGPGVPDVGDAAVLELATPSARLFAGRLSAGTTRSLPTAAGVHLFVVGGSLTVTGLDADVRLDAGDSALLTHADGAECAAAGSAEVLVWAWDQ